ncbi:MAG TPA: O-antigen ligase family protein, partial [Patescibacteria group bacterium]|nr:O-antigen ligase family protein [Patescibacteria group bacterium]
TLLLVTFLLGAILKQQKVTVFPKGRTSFFLISLLIFGIIFNSLYSLSPGAHLFGVIKFLEFVFLGFYIANNFTLEDIPFFVDTLALSSIVSSVLAVWQFFCQSSIGGLWYYLGERTFNPLSIGIAKFSLDGDVLRSYGAFPHPNLLAFFLLISIVFMVFELGEEKNKYEKGLLIVGVVLSSIAILLTFSRVIIILCFVFLAWMAYKRFRKYILYFIPICILILGYLVIYHARFISPETLLRDSDFRVELISESFTIFKNHIYFGTGLNNYFYYQVSLIKSITPTLYQPAHNIFIYWLLSVGLFGFPILLFVLFKAISKLLKDLKTKNKKLKTFYQGILFILLALIVVGMTDHFFLTLEQGQIMSAVILGLSFVVFLPKPFAKRKSKS